MESSSCKPACREELAECITRATSAPADEVALEQIGPPPLAATPAGTRPDYSYSTYRWTRPEARPGGLLSSVPYTGDTRVREKDKEEAQKKREQRLRGYLPKPDEQPLPPGAWTHPDAVPGIPGFEDPGYKKPRDP